GGALGGGLAPETTRAKSTSTSPVSRWLSWFTSVALTVAVHTPGSGFWRMKFSTVFLVSALPPEALKLPTSRPKLPWYTTLEGEVTVRSRSLMRCTVEEVVPGGSRYTSVA